MPAAVVFIVVFLLSAIVHIVQLVRTRTWYFIPFVIGCLGKLLGKSPKVFFNSRFQWRQSVT